MIKVTGCILLIISCSLLGCLKANSYKERTRELEHTMEIIKLLDIYITYKKEPLSKAFHRASAAKKCWFSNVLSDCCNLMNEKHSLDASWETSIKNHLLGSPLIDDDISIIEDVIMGLGKSDSEGQRRVLDPVLVRLAGNHKAALSREKTLGKMYKTLGVAAGIVITIIII